MNTGRVVIRSSKRLKFTESVRPAMISSGAVSPMTRAMASMTPVTMPLIAVGSTTLVMVRHSARRARTPPRAARPARA